VKGIHKRKEVITTGWEVAADYVLKIAEKTGFGMSEC
jgi:hypothetical protein